MSDAATGKGYPVFGSEPSRALQYIKSVLGLAKAPRYTRTAALLSFLGMFRQIQVGPHQIPPISKRRLDI